MRLFEDMTFQQFEPHADLSPEEQAEAAAYRARWMADCASRLPDRPQALRLRSWAFNQLLAVQWWMGLEAITWGVERSFVAQVDRLFREYLSIQMETDSAGEPPPKIRVWAQIGDGNRVALFGPEYEAYVDASGWTGLEWQAEQDPESVPTRGDPELQAQFRKAREALERIGDRPEVEDEDFEPKPSRPKPVLQDFTGVAELAGLDAALSLVDWVEGMPALTAEEIRGLAEADEVALVGPDEASGEGDDVAPIV